MSSSTQAADSSVSLETAQAERQVWLLKLPSMVATAWQRSDQHNAADPIAKVTYTFDPLDGSQDVTMELNGSECADIPKCYSLNLQKDVVPMHIFAETQGKLCLEGKVERKYDMKPNNRAKDEYRKLCRERDRMSNLKTRTIRVIGEALRPATIPMPSTFFPFSKDNNKRRPTPAAKGNEGKRTRCDRGSLEDSVFQLFEKKPYWALKNLVSETDQPVAFLKEVLNDLCIYNKRGTNQGTYELKPEYRRDATAEEEKTS